MKQSFEEIVQQNMPWIFRYVRSKVNSREIAEDLTQWNAEKFISICLCMRQADFVRKGVQR